MAESLIRVICAMVWLWEKEGCIIMAMDSLSIYVSYGILPVLLTLPR